MEDLAIPQPTPVCTGSRWGAEMPPGPWHDLRVMEQAVAFACLQRLLESGSLADTIACMQWLAGLLYLQYRLNTNSLVPAGPWTRMDLGFMPFCLVPFGLWTRMDLETVVFSPFW